MNVELIRAPGLFDGVPYAYASVAPTGAPVYTAGACPLDGNGATVGAGDIRLQARQCVANLLEALAASGAGVTDILKTTIYVASSTRADLVAAWEEISAAFGDHDPPSTLLGVTVLGYPDQLVELEAVACARPDDRNRPGTEAAANDHGVRLEVGSGDAALSARLNQELHDHNVRVTGADDQAELSVKAVDDLGELVGGVSGWTWGGCGGVDLLWVRADRRHERWGSALMAAAEDEARRRGCTQMIVSTLSFQAPGFYRRLGYAETGRTEGHPTGHADLHFTKPLG